MFKWEMRRRMIGLVVVWALALVLGGCAPPEKTGDGFDPAAGIPEEGGFYEPSDATVPAAVREASASVFRIVVPTQDRTQEINTSFGIGASMRYYLTFGENDPMMRAVMLKQVAYCESQQGFFNTENKKCRLALSFHKGSGFLLGTGKSFWTAAHMLERAFAPREVTPIFIFDKDANILFDPYANPPLVYRPHPTSIEAHLDYAVLTLPVEIGAPLKLAPRRPSGQEPLFAIGFPSCTNCPARPGMVHDFGDRSPAPNSNGKDLRVSRGRPYAINEPPLVHTSVDVMPGNSGGPGVNSEGQVFGVAILSGSSSYRRSVHRLGIFVTPPEWKR